MPQQAHTFSQQVTTDVTLNYLLHLPPNVNDGTMHPLILFLHGSGERGSDLERVKAYGPPQKAEREPDFPFVVVSPQCPADEQWVFLSVNLKGLVDEVCQRYPVDKTRLYLTGLSLGGSGVWQMAAHYPNYFAAVAPICADAHRKMADRLTTVPIWAFHGALDDVVPPDRSKIMVEAVNQLGGHARLTLYPDLNHNSWDRTYANPDLYTWFLQQRS